MTTVYNVSGRVLRRNERLGYKRSWPLPETGQYCINTDEQLQALKEKIARNEYREDNVVCELRDLKIERVTSFEWNEDEDQPLCGNDPETREHWSWFGNHEPGCAHREE